MFYIKKKYLYLVIIILILCLTGVISIPIFNKKECVIYKEEKIYIKLPFVNIPYDMKTCKEYKE